jgi:predicted secreted Zn-dependent protease
MRNIDRNISLSPLLRDVACWVINVLFVCYLVFFWFSNDRNQSASRAMKAWRPSTAVSSAPALSETLLTDAGVQGPNERNIYVEKIQYYKIHGRTFDQLWRDIELRGPVDEQGMHWHGATRWDVRWNYNFSPSLFDCSVIEASVHTDATIEMPEWVEMETAPYFMRRAWNEYWNKLLEHERGHAQNGRDAAAQVQSQIEGLAPSATCKELRARVASTGTAQVRIGREMDDTYDAATQHGAKQVMWPEDEVGAN